MSFDLRAHTVLLCIAGSRALGIHTPTSDVDIRGCAVPPVDWLLGYRKGWLRRWEQADTPAEMAVFADLLTAEETAAAQAQVLEGSVYDLRKLVALAADCNPNLLEVLWCRPSEVRLCTAVGERLREAAPAFLSQKARHTFGGYARSQLQRIRSHRRWLLEPPKAPPARADFGLPEHSLISADQRAAAQAAVQKRLDQWNLDLADLPLSEAQRLRDRIAAVLAEQGLAAEDARWRAAARTVGMDDNLIEAMDRERRYKAALRHWRQYQHWKTSRNPARAELEARFGYDTKHGAHLVRLLRMGREILVEGRVIVWRGDRDGEELRAIRAGAWEYEQLVAWAEEADAELEQIVAEGRAVVPPKPDVEALDALTVELMGSGLLISPFTLDK